MITTASLFEQAVTQAIQHNRIFVILNLAYILFVSFFHQKLVKS